MSKGTDRTAQFLAAMSKAQDTEPEAVTQSAATPSPPAEAVVHQIPDVRKPKRALKPVSRASLKHFGGYLDDDTLEKIALLRIRLKMDNSALIKHAIDELHRKHHAKRAFGDA